MPVATTLTDTQGIVAIVALAIALVALLLGMTLAVTVRRLRRAQGLVLGDAGGARPSGSCGRYAGRVRGAAQSTSRIRAYASMGVSRDAETALQGTLAHRALVRYDAYNELSGRQSMSIALLDDEQSGIVLSCIHHRDQARVYAKQMQAGQPELELSPEEAEAVRLALSSTARTGDGAGHPA